MLTRREYLAASSAALLSAAAPAQEAAQAAGTFDSTSAFISRAYFSNAP